MTMATAGLLTDLAIQGRWQAGCDLIPPPFADMSLTGLYGILSWGVGCAIWSWAAKSKPIQRL